MTVPSLELELEIEEEVTPLEYQIFALAFREPGAIERFAEDLPAEYVGAIHGDTGIHEFYNAFLHFYEKTGLDPVNPIAFKAWLETETDISEALGGPGPISYFVNTVMALELSTVDSVIKVLRFRANQRKQLNSIQSLQTLLAKKGHKTDAEVDQIIALTDQIRALESNLEYNPLDVVVTAGDVSERADGLMEIPDFLSTPFLDYNRALGYTEDGGYFRGAVHAVVAASGKGKSTFAKILANHWLDTGYTVLTINFEEAQAHWERILMTQIIKENVYARARLWTPEEKEDKLAHFRERLAQWGDRMMVRHSPDSSYYDDLELWLRDIMGHNENVPDVVIIDTIQSMLGRGGGPRWEQYERMMIRLEKLAKDMNAVFIITAQQNTNAMKEKREMIEQQDVGGSISIVQKCSVITFITEKKLISGDDSEDEFLMQLQIPKNRITGSTFTYDPPLVMYNDETKSYEEFVQVEMEPYDPQHNYLEEIDVFGEDDFNL